MTYHREGNREDPVKMGSQSPPRLCAIYFRDTISFLLRADVDKCRQVSQHLQQAAPGAGGQPRRIHSSLELYLVDDVPVSLPLIHLICSHLP